MELELRHFEMYGLGLKVQDKNGVIYDYMGCSHINEKLFLQDEKGKYWVKEFKQLKPLLNPISKIIDLKIYEQIFPVDDVELEVFGKRPLDLAEEFILTEALDTFFPFEQWQILLRNKIDILQLIKNDLAIEIED